jgi:hypothetical protein
VNALFSAGELDIYAYSMGAAVHFVQGTGGVAGNDGNNGEIAGTGPASALMEETQAFAGGLASPTGVDNVNSPYGVAFSGVPQFFVPGTAAPGSLNNTVMLMWNGSKWDVLGGVHLST